ECLVLVLPFGGDSAADQQVLEPALGAVHGGGIRGGGDVAAVQLVGRVPVHVVVGDLGVVARGVALHERRAAEPSVVQQVAQQLRGVGVVLQLILSQRDAVLHVGNWL